MWYGLLLLGHKPARYGTVLDNVNTGNSGVCVSKQKSYLKIWDKMGM
jgi:hypothetical protein